MVLSEIQAALREHPGVRDAVAAVHEENGARKIVGYIVPRPEYLQRFLSDEDELKRLQKWRKTFDLVQLGKEAVSSPLAFNIAGWNSSYTRRPIPAEEMREWVENTVEEILALGPKEVLEIGCGTGLLLLRIARHCTSYVATDFSAAVLQRLREQLAKVEGVWSHVALFERGADNFEGFAANSFDTVILNSVIQYFPSAAGLVRVLEQVARIVKPGGRIFVGDVRSLPLLGVYCASVELYQAGASMNLAELHERVLRRIQQQEELVVSPEFFLRFQRQNPKISRVEIWPKRGTFANELNRFRFNVAMTVASETRVDLEPNWEDWPAAAFDVESLRQKLANFDSGVLGYRNVDNALLEKDVEAAKEIAKGDSSRTVAQLQDQLARTKAQAVRPCDLRRLATELGASAEMSWASSRQDGRFDVVFRRLGRKKGTIGNIAWPRPDSTCDDLAGCANTPGQTSLNEKLIRELMEYSMQRLPADLVPEALIVVNAIPLGENRRPDLNVSLGT